jgi:hypothetical protein
MGLITRARAQNFLRENQLIARSDPGNDLDPSLAHRLEPLSLLLGILVWDGADGVAALALAVGGLHQEPVYGGANGDQLAARSRRGPPECLPGGPLLARD